MRKLLFAFGLLASIVLASCSLSPLPAIFNNTPTPPPTQVPLPTRVAIPVPTPTVANLWLANDTSEAGQMLKDFIEAVTTGNLEGALSYWNTSQPGQLSGYANNVRKIVQEWIDKKRQLVVNDIIYAGVDATGKSVTMTRDDPRVDRATAGVRIDGIDYRFYLTLLKGGWFIEGVNTK